MADSFEMSSSSSQPPPQQQQLSALYQEIAQRAAVATKNWPDSSRLVQCLEYHPNPREDHQDGVYIHHYRAPVFDMEQGPLGLIALILDGSNDGTQMYNAAAVPIVAACMEQFRYFEHELRHICQDSTLHMIPTEVPHICIAMYQAHPVLLVDDDNDNNNKKERLQWKPTEPAIVEQLVQHLDTAIDALQPFCHIELTLDALLLTPDGAMIAGFVPNSETYQTLKTATSDAARAVLGTLTSRPKNLIHVTVGRILGFGETPPMVVPEQGQVCQLVQKYNQEVLPAVVQNMSHRTFTLQQISLLRNTVWFCEQNIIYKTWSLGTE